MSRLLIHPAAACEIGDAARSYDASRPGLGVAFLRQLDGCFRNIADFPEMAASVLPGYRRAVVQGFPFIVVYRIAGDQLQVLALFPSLADPSRLLARLSSASSS